MISIIIPALNEAKTIGKVLKGIKAHVKQKHEVIVVDDCSTDNTAKIAAKYGAKVIEHNEQRGGILASELKQCKGTYIIRMDADGEHDPKDVPKLAAKLRTHDVVLGARSYRSRVMERVLEHAFGLPEDFFSGFVGFHKRWIPFIVNHEVCTFWELPAIVLEAGRDVAIVGVTSRRSTRPSRFGGAWHGNLKTIGLFFKYRSRAKQLKEKAKRVQ